MSYSIVLKPLPLFAAVALGVIVTGILLMAREGENGDAAVNRIRTVEDSQPRGKPGVASRLLSILDDADHAEEGGPAERASPIQRLDRFAQDLLALSPDEEQTVGAEIHEAIREEYPATTDSAEAARITRLARPLLEHHGLDPGDFQFAVVESGTVNAFAHVGGYVYVNRGLLDLARDDEEVQFVLGHEIGHIVLGHCSEKLTYTVRSQQALGEDASAVVSLLYHLIAVGYAPELEFEADEFAQETMLALGKDPQAGARILRRMHAQFESDAEIELPPAITESRWFRILVAVDRHLQTHPGVDERVRRIERVQL